MYIRHPRILILTAGYGEGHLQVSRALEHSFRASHVKDVEIIDLIKEAHPIINSVSSKLYQMSTFSSQFGFDYYGWSYYATRDNNPLGSVNRYLNALGKRKIQEMIEDSRPDAIINTFPFGAVTEMGRNFSIPTSTVITDYTLHSRWIHPDTDKYYVATEDLKDQLIKDQGAAPESVSVTGIPVRSTFYEGSTASFPIQKDSRAIKNRVLIMAGSFAIFHHIVELVQILLEKGNCEIALVCGRHEKMILKLNSLFKGHPDVQIFGYVEHMPELMAGSSCIVTKAGGITLTEAVVTGLPVFIYKPFGGQERENALYFTNKGLAEIAHEARELGEQICKFLKEPAASDQIRNRMATLCKGEAAELIVKDILTTLQEQRSLNKTTEFAAHK
ncbi:processive diacylglycerol beta-glucosyltransferase [Paenibacillus sp. J23TS9]|uniref:MGDG synthase family glycosyltransferase n=1 Tax=Paenibacillus sp. J23TS9 TaxID=2807193 RepID=UPI001B258D12|nr:glycosyltransferase [Paenibacillus sp. J23TS9]GIP26859.1 processive diacylglycerol beta-glucosyltransferase [Paenibacillus sp. J23TS9]